MRPVERYLYLLIIGTLLFLLLLKECNKHKCPPCPECPQITGGTDTPYIPIPKVDSQPQKPKVAKPILSRFEGRKRNLVTQVPIIDKLPPIVPEIGNKQIIEDYKPACFLNNYEDTLKLGDFGSVIVKDKIQGTILSRSFSWTAKPIQLKEEKKRNNWYLGVDAVGYRGEVVSYIGISGIYQNKNTNSLLGIGVGTMNNSLSYRISYHLPLNKRK